MFNSINKILVNQANNLYRQPGLLYKLCQDRDFSINKTIPMSKSCQNFIQIREDPPLNIRTSSANPHRKYTTIKRSFDNLDILRNYYGLIAKKRSFSTLNGRVSKKSLKTHQQARAYPSLLKKIASFFKAKPVKAKKSASKQVPCTSKGISKVCVKNSPPNINFQKAMECKEEVVKKAPPEFQIVCPQKVEVDHKEKPPFQSEGGQFVEDRLCKEMPEKRCQRLMEEHDIKKEERHDVAELKKQERIKLMKEKEIKACVKNKKKENSSKEKTHPLKTCGEEPKKLCKCPAKELNCNVADVKTECDKPKPAKVKKYKVGEIKFQCKVKSTQNKSEDIKDVKPCSDAKVVNQASAIKLVCPPIKVKEESPKNKCENPESCHSLNEKLTCPDVAKLDCAATKGKKKCPKFKFICKTSKSVEKMLTCSEIKTKEKSESEASCEEADAKRDKCRAAKPCAVKKKDGDCQLTSSELKGKAKSESEESCKESDAKRDKCRAAKPCAVKKKDDDCQSTCSKLKGKTKSDKEASCEESDAKGDKCAMTNSSDAKKKDGDCKLTCSELKGKAKLETEACNVKKKDDDCKKPPKGGCGSCESGDSTISCSGSNKCGDMLKFSITQEEESPIPLVPNNSPISLIAFGTNEILEQVPVNSLESLKSALRGITLLEDRMNDLNAYSKVAVHLSQSRIISINFDAIDQDANLPDLSGHSRKKFLEPITNTTRSLQRRDSRSIALSTSSLSKIYRTKYPMKHTLGKIPMPPSACGECPVFPLHNLHTNKNNFVCSSELNFLDMNGIRRRYYSNMPPPIAPHVDPRQRVEQRDPRGTVEFREPRIAAPIEDYVKREKVEDPIRRDYIFLSDTNSNNTPKNANGSGGSNTNNNNGNDKADDKCKMEKPPCPSLQPCCKLDKSKCDMPPEQLKKELPSCKSGSFGTQATTCAAEVCPKNMEKKKDKCFDPKDCKLCNFDQAVQAEQKAKEKELCISKLLPDDTICPPTKKKQLCCYQKREKPKLPVDPCCSKQNFPKGFECALCKKFEILDLPTKPKRKPSVCKAKKCGGGIKECSTKTSSPEACKKLPKRPNVFSPPKCPKPKFKEEPPKQKKKELVSIAGCSKSPCYQKKCSKKKPPKAPCPAPIKLRKFDVKKDECPPMPRKKVAKPVDKATQKRLSKMCEKPPKRRSSTTKCPKRTSDCDKKKMNKKAAEDGERERQEKEAMATTYANMKHTDWRAVPVRGDNRWCSKGAVEKDDKCKKELSKTVLPSTEEKYRSPRYKQSPKPKASNCPKSKKSNKPNVRKMSSYPGMEHVPIYNIGRVFSCVDIKKETVGIRGSRSLDDLAGDKNQD